MDKSLNAEKKLHIDKSNWQLTKLGDLASEISNRVDNPAQSEYLRFVGLEHFVSGDLKIKSWGTTDNLTSSAKAFQKGDILFARRNAYLRRASMVDFDGCCSGDAFVLKENHEKVVPGFLAFLMNSSALWDFANSNAAGTMSKRVKWRDLAEYQILLPPKDQQEKLSNLLWAIDEVVEKNIRFLNTSSTFYEVEKNHLVLNGINNEIIYSDAVKFNIAKKWLNSTIGELLKINYIESIQDGNHGETHPKSSDYCDEGIPFIMANTLVNGEIDFINAKKLPKIITDKLRIGFSMPNDVLLSHKGTVGEVAIVPENIEWPYLVLTPQVTYYRVNPNKLLNKFLYFVFSSRYFQLQLSQLSSQSTRAYIGITAQQKLKVVIPDTTAEQLEIVTRLFRLEENLKSIKNLIESSKNLQKNLINQIF